MTGILGILGTIMIVVRMGQMARTWWRKKQHAPRIEELRRK